VLGVLVLATPLAVDWLNLSTSSIWLVTAVYMALGVAMVSLLGVAQGLSRFRVVGIMLGGPQGALRPLLVLPFVAVVGASGPMWALMVATVVGLAVLGWVVVPYLRRSGVRTGVAGRLPRLWTTFVALIAFASLISSDAIVAKIALPAESAGLYNTGALLGKIAFYGPSALAILLLPLVTTRLEQGQDIRRLLTLTLLITITMGAAVSFVLFVAPRILVTAVFGPQYADAFPLAAPYALVMTVYAALYVHLMMALAAAETRFIRILVGIAVLQIGLFVVLHSSWWQLLFATALAALTGVVLHEVTSPYGLVGLWRHRTKTRQTTP
jgi:O-antigen/teichoic acid export membrane protein